MRRALLDQGLAPLAAKLLCEEGWDAIHVSSIDMYQASDAEILELARQSGRVCVTLDHDFHTHLAWASSVGPSVILLRVQGLGGRSQAALIRSVWDRAEAALADGAAVSADLRQVRIRRLPFPSK